MAKEEKVEPFDIDRLLASDSVKNRVAKMGVELEGAWRIGGVPPGMQLEIDTSVFKNDPPDGHKSGELPLGPFQPGGMAKALRKCYPHKVDHTCGLHIHMSFESMRHYGLLMVPEYQETIIEYISRWAKLEGFPPTHHIWTRLAGKSVYCQKKFWPDAQIEMKRKDHDQTRVGHRYTIIHYSGRLKTIEVRVLPMMQTVDQSIQAVNLVLNVTNACLALQKGREEKVLEKLEMALSEGWEEDIEVRL